MFDYTKWRRPEIENHAEELLINGQFDLVIINSVIQYFPSSAYLDDVLTKATALIAPGGQIFLGDIRASAKPQYFGLVTPDITVPMTRVSVSIFLGKTALTKAHATRNS